MKLKVTFSSVCLLVAIPVLLLAGKPPVVKWMVKNPFEQKVIIENKGQYLVKNAGLTANDIYFGAIHEGLQYYFAKNSIWIEADSLVKNTDQLNSQGETSPNPNDNAKYKLVSSLHQLSFQGANPDVQISGVNEVSGNFNFRVSETASVRAQGYKKIIYTNLYPGIDMEFYFPDNKKGFEYDFIVHPGADISQIKIAYPLNKGITLSQEGNIIVKSVFGSFIDHAPVAAQALAIPCSFALANGIVQFNVGNYDKSKTLTIDPWTVYGPAFVASGGVQSPYDNGYYIDYDDAGNCYVYGGGGKVGGKIVPWVLNKYNGNGGFITSYSEPFSSSGITYIGHFGVDRVTQSAYICEGYNAGGAELVKLNQGLSQIGTYSGNARMEAMWRIAFSRCNVHEAVVGGGNSTSSTQGAPYYNAMYLDTSLTGMTPVNSSGAGSGYHDVDILALDNALPNSNAYMGISTQNWANNTILSVPTPTLTGILWSTTDNYIFGDAESVYIGGSGNTSTLPNGFSGMTVSNDLFTYDSYLLEKWNKTAGTRTAAKEIVKPAGGDSTHMSWAGITGDSCDNIFLGAETNILQYDGNNMTLVNTIPAPDTVFDVKLGNYNILYACGDTFVEAWQFDTLQLPYCHPFHGDTSTTPATCTTKGSATVTPAPKVGGHVYSCVWSNGQTGFTATDLDPGTDTATITDSSCAIEKIKVLVLIKKLATYPNVTISNVSMCLGVPATLTANSTTNGVTYTWSPANGLSSTSGSSVTANPVSTASYTLVATVPNSTYCPDTIYPVVVTVNPLPVINVTPNPASICINSSTQLTASGALTYLWTPTGGLNPTTGATVTADPTITSTYTVTGTDKNGCIDSSTVTVNVNPYPVVSFNPDTETICTGKSVTLTATGTLGATFTWQNNPPGLSDTTSGGTALASPISTTTYNVYGTSNGCTTEAFDTVTVLPAPTVLIKALQPSTLCINDSAVVLNGYGTPGGGIFSGAGVTNGSPDTTFTPSLAGAGGPFTITYTYTSPNGCVNTATTQVQVAPLPTINIIPSNPVVCSGNPAILMASGALTYTWNPTTNLTVNNASGSNVSVTPTSQTMYTVTGTDSNTCVNDTSVTVNIGTLPQVALTILQPSSCNRLLYQFSATVFDTGVTYLWKFGDGTSAPGPTPQHEYTTGGMDTVKLIETNFQGCVDSVDTPQQVESLSELAILPDAFTPSVLGKNEFFGPVAINCNSSTNYIFRIYNRWGEMVYQSTNTGDPGWDGTFNGKPEPLGVYVYYMEFNCGNCPVSRKGNVTLLR